MIERTAFSELWVVLEPDDTNVPALIDRNLPAAGYPHFAPDHFDEINPAVIDRILAIPVHERWRRAKTWAANLTQQDPNKEKLADFKRLLNQFCKLASRRHDQMLVILPLR